MLSKDFAHLPIGDDCTFDYADIYPPVSYRRRSGATDLSHFRHLEKTLFAVLPKLARYV